ncbi:hypothetical protein [Algoriphagus marinus]|nr:hypothetical protein [Algoriphagus marinus]
MINKINLSALLIDLNYPIKGNVFPDFDFYSIEVTKCERLEYWNGGE